MRKHRQTIAGMVLCGLPLLAGAQGCGGDNGGTCAPGELCVGSLVDLNHDGKPDGRALDTNGDGQVDSLDTNFDGKPDEPFPFNSSPSPINGDGDEPGDLQGGDGGGIGTGPITVDSDWCKALGVLRDSCQECHSKSVVSTAPMHLDTYQDTQAAAVTDPTKKVYQLISTRIHDAKMPMPEPPRMLSATQLAALDNWIAGGALPGPDPTCGTSAGNPSPVGGSPDAGTTKPVEESWPAECTPDNIYTVTANDSGQKHVVPANSETHIEFYFDAPWGNDDVQAIAFKPITDNAKVLHHWILYQNGGSQSIAGGQFLTGWAPGKDGLHTFPSDIGVYLPSGKQVLRLDTHYFNKGTATKQELDGSGVQICVVRGANKRPNTATTFPFGTILFSVPPGMHDVTANCTVNANKPAFLLVSSPHMHKLGYHAKFSQTRNGQTTMLQDSSFNFEFQEGKDLNRVPLQTGDQIGVVCQYNNDTGTTVTFGQNTEDEMCFNFAMYYPKDAFSCNSTPFGF